MATTKFSFFLSHFDLRLATLLACLPASLRVCVCVCMRAIACMCVCVSEMASLRELEKFLALKQSLDLNLVIMYILSVKFICTYLLCMYIIYEHDETFTNTHAIRYLCEYRCVYMTNLTHLSISTIRIGTHWSSLTYTHTHTNTQPLTFHSH